jgi:hypothetical protein
LGLGATRLRGAREQSGGSKHRGFQQPLAFVSRARSNTPLQQTKPPSILSALRYLACGFAAERQVVSQQSKRPLSSYRIGVSATYEYDPAEHYQALRAVTKLTPLRWIGLLCFLVLPAIVVALTVVAARSTGHLVGQALITIVPWVLLLFVWGALIPLSQRRRAKRLPKLDASLQGLQERRVDGEGYHSRGNGVALDIPWHAMKKAVETDKVFLFFYNWQCAYYFPKRTLNATQIGQVREFTRSGLGERARLLMGEPSRAAG